MYFMYLIPEDSRVGPTFNTLQAKTMKKQFHHENYGVIHEIVLLLLTVNFIKITLQKKIIDHCTIRNMVYIIPIAYIFM